jgi:hypothetical protein
VLVGVVALKSCEPPPDPKVELFEITPTTVCPGGSVTVTWKVSGGLAALYESNLDVVQLEKDGKLGDLLLGKAEGSTQVQVPKNTTFKLASFLNTEKYAASDSILVTVADAAGVVGLKFPACVGSGWGADASTKDWATQARVTNIVNDTLDRAVVLTHAGHDFSIASGGATDDIPAGTPLSGLWTATATLEAGEGCGSGPSVEGSNPAPIKPTNLVARVQYTCE